MGTNYYWKIPHQVSKDIILPTGETIWRGSGFDHMDPAIHLGKRSGAGHFCWDCRVTLCKKGKEGIHSSGPEAWYTSCPQCGKSKEDGYRNRFERGEIAAPHPPKETQDPQGMPTGIHPACSFSWAQDPETVMRILKKVRRNKPLVENEYGELFTGQAFLSLLERTCPVFFVSSIGQYFG